MYPSNNSGTNPLRESIIRSCEESSRAMDARMNERMRQWDASIEANKQAFRASQETEKAQEFQRKMMEDQFNRQMQQQRAQHEHERRMKQMELDAFRRRNGQ